MQSFDFLEHQRRARRSSQLVVALFVLMVLVIGGIVGGLAGLFAQGQPQAGRDLLAGFDPILGGYAMAGTMAVILVTAAFKAFSLGGDGARVALSLGAEEVDPNTSNPYLRRYLNVVEEMAIASSLPRPRVFVMRHENGINAFAAGNSPENGAVAMTHGALSKLNRDEIAGVVAHELAHIANRDTRLNVRLLAMVFGLVALATIGRVVMRSAVMSSSRPRRSNDKNGAAGMLAVLAIGLALIVLGFLGMLGGRILQSAISRRREYLADATAVQYTRNPDGLAGALLKIKNTQVGSHVANGHTEESRHMFFSSTGMSFAGLMATHPPIEDRIRALRPGYLPETDVRLEDRTVLRAARP